MKEELQPEAETQLWCQRLHFWAELDLRCGDRRWRCDVCQHPAIWGGSTRDDASRCALCTRIACCRSRRWILAPLPCIFRGTPHGPPSPHTHAVQFVWAQTSRVIRLQSSFQCWHCNVYKCRVLFLWQHYEFRPCEKAILPATKILRLRTATWRVTWTQFSCTDTSSPIYV